MTLPASQGSLLIAAMVVIIPALLVVLSLLLTPRVNRWMNLTFGVLFTLVNIYNLIGEMWV